MLLKRGALNKAWKERWFELQQGRILCYMKNKGDKPLASVDLSTPGAFQVREMRSECNSLLHVPFNELRMCRCACLRPSKRHSPLRL